MRFYTASKLGSKRAYTPEGYLVCLDVPIARTGEMLYVAGEVEGLLPGKDGLIRVRREPDEVFKPESMASFVGKPTTNDHPPEMVSAKNWRRYAMGSAQNVRRGEGGQSDLLLADLIWIDPDTIKAIESGKDEISCGYDAEYEQDEPGIARQTAIAGNHVALVTEGRCGERCSIGDSAPSIAPRAAGIALRNSEGEFLFLKRRPGGDHSGAWCFPGGSVEADESLNEAARRELSEETALVVDLAHLVDQRATDSCAFTTFLADVSGRPTPVLNDEHTEFVWAPLNAPPEPLHPGVAATIAEKAEALTKITPAETVPARDTAPSCGCGGRHSHDHKPARAKRRKSRDMANKIKGTMLDRLRRAFSTKDEEGFEEAMSAVEEAQEASEEVDFANRIGEAIKVGLEPLVSRLDAVEVLTQDLKRTRDEDTEAEAAAKKAAEEAAAKEAAEKEATTETKDNEALVAFLKSKGLSDDDVAEACKTLSAPADDSAPSDGGLASGGAPSDVAGSGSGMGGMTDPVYNEGGSILDEEPADEKARKAAATMTADTAGLAAAFRDTVARAEVLAPGIKLPTYDGKAKAKPVADSLCALRKLALKSAFDSADRKVHVAPFVTDAAPDFDKMSCGAVKLMFTGAAELAKAANRTVVHDSAAVLDAARTRDNSVRASIKDMNAANAAFWTRS